MNMMSLRVVRGLPQEVSVSRPPRCPPLFGQASNVLPRFHPYPIPDTNVCPSDFEAPSRSETQDTAQTDTKIARTTTAPIPADSFLIPDMNMANAFLPGNGIDA